MAAMSEREQWAVADVAAHLGIKASTVRAYLARGQMPQAEGRIGDSPWWYADTIRAWERLGRGHRSDLT